MHLRLQWPSYLVLLTALVLVSLLAACSPAATTPAPTSKATAMAKDTSGPTTKQASEANASPCPSIKVGVLFSQVGSMASFGKADREGAMLLAEQVNASGGINGCPLEVVAYDPESDLEKGATLAKRLIESDKVAAIVGPESSYIYGAISGIVTQAKIPTFTGNGAFFALKPELQEWTFTTAPGPQIMLSAMWPYLKSLGVKKWAYMSTPDPTGTSTFNIGQGLSTVMGMELVADERQPITDRDMTPGLTKLKAKNPEGLVIVGSGEWGVTALNNAAQVGINVPIVFAGGFTWESLRSGLNPEAAKNFSNLTAKLSLFDQLKADDPARPTVTKFADTFRAKYGRDPDLYNGVGYDAMMQAVTALKAVGPDRGKIKGYAENMKNFMGVTGAVFNTSPQNHIGISMSDAVVAKLDGSKRVTLAGYMSDFMKKLSPEDVKAIEKLKGDQPTLY